MGVYGVRTVADHTNGNSIGKHPKFEILCELSDDLTIKAAFLCNNKPTSCVHARDHVLQLSDGISRLQIFLFINLVILLPKCHLPKPLICVNFFCISLIHVGNATIYNFDVRVVYKMYLT